MSCPVSCRADAIVGLTSVLAVARHEDHRLSRMTNFQPGSSDVSHQDTRLRLRVTQVERDSDIDVRLRIDASLIRSHGPRRLSAVAGYADMHPHFGASRSKVPDGLTRRRGSHRIASRNRVPLQACGCVKWPRRGSGTDGSHRPCKNRVPTAHADDRGRPLMCNSIFASTRLTTSSAADLARLPVPCRLLPCPRTQPR